MNSSTQNPTAARRRGGPVEAQFPGKLHNMLEYAEREGLEATISWVGDGKAFKVHRPDKLVAVLPNFFGQTQYRSFRRQLNMWYFERIQEGPHKGAFVHPFFIKGQRHLCAKMSRHHPPQKEESSGGPSSPSPPSSTSNSGRGIIDDSTGQSSLHPSTGGATIQESGSSTNDQPFSEEKIDAGAGVFGVARRRAIDFSHHRASSSDSVRELLAEEPLPLDPSIHHRGGNTETTTTRIARMPGTTFASSLNNTRDGSVPLRWDTKGNNETGPVQRGDNFTTSPSAGRASSLQETTKQSKATVQSDAQDDSDETESSWPIPNDSRLLEPVGDVLDSIFSDDHQG